MLNRSASLAMSTSVLKALPGKLDIKIHSPSILYLPVIALVFSGHPVHVQVQLYILSIDTISETNMVIESFHNE